MTMKDMPEAVVRQVSKETELMCRYREDPDSLSKSESLHLGILIALCEIERPSDVLGSPNSILSAAQELGLQKQMERVAACNAITELKRALRRVLPLTRGGVNAEEKEALYMARILSLVE